MKETLLYELSQNKIPTVYHVSDKSFTEFGEDKHGVGIWFSDSKVEARVASDIDEKDAILYTTEIRINNPYATKQDPTKELVKELKSKKYDGIILPSVGGFSNDYVIFSPSQVKIIKREKWKRDEK